MTVWTQLRSSHLKDEEAGAFAYRILTVRIEGVREGCPLTQPKRASGK